MYFINLVKELLVFTVLSRFFAYSNNSKGRMLNYKRMSAKLFVYPIKIKYCNDEICI